MSAFNNALQIEHQCPQCGGPVVLEETDRFLSCGYCRVNLYIEPGEYQRYILPPSTYSIDETIFIPYWRIRGMQFSVAESGVADKFLNTSFLALDRKVASPTIGYRAQTLRLRFATGEMKGIFLKGRYNINEIFEKFELLSRKFQVNTKIFQNSFIGETISKIYAPFYIKDGSLCDGILNRAVCKMNEDLTSLLNNRDMNKSWNVKFMSGLCPDCGADLSGSRDSVVLTCRNCLTCWHPLNGQMVKVAHELHKCTDTNIHYIPFWKISADISGLQLETYADLIRTANFPKAIMPWMEEKKIYFFCPAFHLHPKIFLRLAKQMTMVQPDSEYTRDIPQSSSCAVTLDDREAFQTIKVTLANMAAVRKKVFPRLREINVKNLKSMLVFMPFTVRGNEYIHREHKFSLQRNSIRMA